MAEYKEANSMQTVQDRPVDLALPQTDAEIRRDLAACYRLMARYGLDDTIYTHISAASRLSPAPS